MLILIREQHTSPQNSFRQNSATRICKHFRASAAMAIMSRSGSLHVETSARRKLLLCISSMTCVETVISRSCPRWCCPLSFKRWRETRARMLVPPFDSVVSQGQNRLLKNRVSPLLPIDCIRRCWPCLCGTFINNRLNLLRGWCHEHKMYVDGRIPATCKPSSNFNALFLICNFGFPLKQQVLKLFQWRPPLALYNPKTKL